MLERADIERYLADFAGNSAEVMDRVPDKRTPDGAVAGDASTLFEDDAILSGDFVEQRDGTRSGIYGEDDVRVADLVPGKAPIGAHDHAKDLVDTFRYDKPADMDAARLQSAHLAETPWSDDYWGVYHGILGHRYADALFPDSDDWKANFDYVTRRSAAKVVAEGQQLAIDALSPSEKYDLLVGDATFGLTREMWAEGKRFYDRAGKVESWMGICHGWAPAAYMVERPRRIVTLHSPGGVLLRFFPADIKALASLLWANSSPPARFIGSRCGDKEPKKDANGRVLSEAAFDTNPGTWHLAVVNQIGVSKRAMVMDATYDYEVWNQPVCGYEYHYFNPQDMSFAATAREATVARGAFTRDRFSNYRGADCKAVCGVAMRTTYVVERPPTQFPTDDPSRDVTRLVDYFYDLELDASGRILGGEWYLNRHPDFLWTPAPGRRAETPADAFATDRWGFGEAVPESYQAAALRASANGLPLAKVVDRLIELAST
jgi:hypothetical protein